MMAYAETASLLVIGTRALQLLNLGSALLLIPAHGTTGPVSLCRSLPLLVYVDMASGILWELGGESCEAKKKTVCT